LSNDDQQKTQAIPSLDDLLKEDRKKRMGGAEPEEEENAAPTEAIDFNALLASGRFPDLEAPAEAPGPPANPFGASKQPIDDMDDLPPTAPPSPAMMGGMGKPSNMGGDMGSSSNMGSGSGGAMGSSGGMGPGGGMGGGKGNMGGGNSGGNNSGKGAMPPASPPPQEGGKKNLYIALGVAAFFLFCCCPLGAGGGYYGFFVTRAAGTDPIAITGGPEDGNTDNDGATDDGALNTGAVADMTPDKLEARVKDLGWNVIGEPTRINDKSVTLPVTKGLTGGAVSLNEFDIGLATDAFVKTMSDNPDAAVARSGDKVVSVIMPGKKAEADALLKDILK
jgi:hypothetical protein